VGDLYLIGNIVVHVIKLVELGIEEHTGTSNTHPEDVIELEPYGCVWITNKV